MLALVFLQGTKTVRLPEIATYYTACGSMYNVPRCSNIALLPCGSRDLRPCGPASEACYSVLKVWWSGRFIFLCFPSRPNSTPLEHTLFLFWEGILSEWLRRALLRPLRFYYFLRPQRQRLSHSVYLISTAFACHWLLSVLLMIQVYYERCLRYFYSEAPADPSIQYTSSAFSQG